MGRETPAEGSQTPNAAWSPFRLVEWVRSKVSGWSREPEKINLRPETITSLRTCVDMLPEGPHKKVFAGVLRAIEAMADDKRKQITEQSVPAGTVVLDPKKENSDVLLLPNGTMTVHLETVQEIIYCPAPDFFGEMSAMLTGGKPTALVDALSDASIVRIPQALFASMRQHDREMEEGVQTIMNERVRRSRILSTLKKTSLNPAQEIAEIAMLRLRAPEQTDKAALLDAVRSLADKAGDAFHIETISAGTPFVRQGVPLNAVRLILDGRANIFRHGGRVGVAADGDVIGACDVFTPSKASQFEYSAISDMTVLIVDPQAFLALRPQVESLVSQQRESLLRHERQTAKVESAGEVSDKVILGVHQRAAGHTHYVPLRSSGNDLIFECGRAEQVLCWLGVRGFLSYRGSTGWEVAQETPAGDFVLQRPADKPVTAKREDLIEENLRLVIRKPLPEDTKNVLGIYTKGGLSFEQARFLVERGIVPNATPNKAHLDTFARSFESIQRALSYIAEWGEKNTDAGERRMLGTMLQFLLIDTTHDIGITTLMKDPATRDIVLRSLDEVLSLPEATEAQFRETMDTESQGLRQRFREDDQRWNVAGSTRRVTMLKAHLLTHPRWNELFSLSSAEPTPKQAQLLEQYVQTLDTQVCPTLVRWMQDILAPLRASDPAFPLVTGRTKSAEGILDKMRRMKGGNRGKEARTDYSLGDVPDAVGARVIVKDAAALEQAMALIENKLKDRIFEKDDFYGNPRKQVRSPYRLVTYTVRCEGLPAEIQLQTLPSAIVANIDHDIIYKPYVPADNKERSLVSSLQRRVAVKETRDRRILAGSKNVLPLQQAQTAAAEAPPMRHSFQSSSPDGVCVCAYIAEGQRHWERDLQDARDYFRWYKNGGATVTMHQGSSAIDCCACIGAPTWQEFRALVLRRTKERCKTPEVIDALEREGAPLFVLEEFARDLEVETNEASFCALIKERFSPKACEEIENALAIMKRAHAGQSYAIEKQDEDGKPVYPSSLALKHIPYANHCIQAARMAAECGVSTKGVQAELLHDAIEDTDLTEEQLAAQTSPEVATRVRHMSRGKTESREAYMARVAVFTGEDKVDKALDRYHNLLRAFNLRDSKKYLDRIVSESKTIFAGDFAPNAALSNYAVRFQMLLEAVEQLRNRKYGNDR